MPKLTVFLFFIVISISSTDGRTRRLRRGVWPNILAAGGNTFAASGYYNMQSYIAYPETGYGFNPNTQGWNPYGQGYYPTNQYNNLNPYGYNQPLQYGNDQNVFNGGYPYGGAGNYNGYYPSPAGNQWFPPNNNMAGLMRSNPAGPPRPVGNPMGQTQIERFRRSVLSSGIPARK